MRIREPRGRVTGLLWLWAVLFGGIPLVMLFLGAGRTGGGPALFLLLFPAIAAAIMIPVTRRSMRAGFELARDGIHGAHDAERHVLSWDEVERIEWRWARETSGVKVNGRPLPDGYALHAVLVGGRPVRLMQRVAPRYGQQQDLNQQLAAATTNGVLPVPFDATIPTHRDGGWSGTPPPPGASQHTRWDADDVPQVGDSPLDDSDTGPSWPTG